MTEWKTPHHLTRHFREHRGEMRYQTIEEYDASAQETLTIGTYFTYTQHFGDGSSEDRTGCFHAPSERLVVLDSDNFIVTHFLCDADYVRGLPYSNYDE